MRLIMLLALVLIALSVVIPTTGLPGIGQQLAHAKTAKANTSAIPSSATVPQLKTKYALPNWWGGCLKYTTWQNSQVCIQWNTSKTQCDKTNYVNDVPNVNPKSIKVLTDTSGNPAIWRGIAACGPLPRLVPQDQPDHFVYFYPADPNKQAPEQEFECTELVKRYLDLAYGLKPLASTNGSQIVNNYTSTYAYLLHKVDNNDTSSTAYNGTLHMVPVEGDVLSVGNITSIGHTAIITASDIDNVGNGTITILQQNVAWGTTPHPVESLSVSNWIIQAGSAGAVSSWMTTRPVVVQKNWSTVQSDPSVTNGGFRSVISLTNGEAYAAGWEGSYPGRGLIEHYSNSVWQKVTMPAGAGIVYSIAASSPTDLWAVGYTGQYGSPYVMHGDGTTWQILTIPQLWEDTYLYGVLNRVIAFSPSNVWIVGSNNSRSTLIAHFDGTAWNIDNFSVPGVLTDIQGTGDNLWTVGDGGAGVQHWNGYFWASVTIPAVSSSDALSGVAVLSSTNVWVAGTANNDALLEHLSGTKWTVVSTSAISPASLFTPMASFGNDIWVAGYRNIDSLPPLVYHYVQPTWVPMLLTISSGASFDTLYDLTFASNHTVWAVGASYTSFPTTGVPLIWQYT
jgi:hypothetical protein